MATSAPLVMPKLGLTMTEGIVAAWLARPGQRVAAGEVLLVVETEKTTTDVEAPGDGVLTEIVVPAGEKVPVGTVLARWSPEDGGERERAAPAPRPAAAARTGRDGSGGGRVVATPLARRLARERGVDLRTIAGSGPGGRIKAGDVPASSISGDGGSVRPERSAGGAESKAEPEGDLLELTPFQAAMARRVSEANRDIPHFYVTAEADVGFLLDYRHKLEEIPGSRRVSLNHLLLKAVGQALVDHPQANVVWESGRLRRLRAPDVGFAVATPRGVAMPVLRDAGHLALPEVAARAGDLAERSRQGRLSERDVGGGATAISNLGMHGATLLAPIINPSHSSILGVGAVRDVFRPGPDGRPLLRHELGLVLACDHRVFDGVAAMGFLQVVIGLLQNPLRLTGR